jgi:hypothetical protein
LNAIALVSSWKLENLDAIEWWGGWGIYSPNHQTSHLVEAAVVWRTGQSGAPPDTVRCASHVTRSLGFDRWSSDKWGLLAVRWCTRQVLLTVRCACCACSNLCARRRTLNALQSTVGAEVAVAPLAHRTVRCATGHCPVHTPDGPVNYSGATSIFPKVASSASSSLVHRTLSGGAPNTVRWHTRQSGAPDQGAFGLSLVHFV